MAARLHLYSDPQQSVRKRGVCLKVSYWDERDVWLGSGFIVEIEGRFTRSRSEITSGTSKNSPILFVWSDAVTDALNSVDEGDGNTVTPARLREVILLLVSRGGNAAVEDPPPGVRCQSRRHSSNTLELKQLIGELYGCIER